MPLIGCNLQLWVSKVGERTRKIEQDTIPLLSSSEAHRLKRTNSCNKKREYLLSRALMRNSLSQVLDTPLSGWEFIEQSNSIPTISNLPANIFISLSHSNGLILFGISMFPIGVDIELIKDKENLSELSGVFMSSKEIQHLKKLNHEKQTHYFYNIWCAKESYYKANPYKQSDMSFKSISIFDVIKESDNWNLIMGNINQYCYSITIRSRSTHIDISKHNFLYA